MAIYLTVQKAAQRKAGLPLGTRLRQTRTYGLQEAEGQVYLVVPKPVIAIGPRGGEITGYNPDGTPEYGGVIKRPIQGAKTVADVSQQALQQTINTISNDVPGLKLRTPAMLTVLSATGQTVGIKRTDKLPSGAPSAPTEPPPRPGFMRFSFPNHVTIDINSETGDLVITAPHVEEWFDQNRAVETAKTFAPYSGNIYSALATAIYQQFAAWRGAQDLMARLRTR